MTTSLTCQAIAFDLDGTIYIGDTLIEGALETITALKKAGKKVFYFTNNSIKTRQEVFAKLRRLGIETDIAMVYTSAYAAGIFLKEKNIRKVSCIGSPGLRSELLERKIRIEDERPEAVIVGLNDGFNYADITKALNAVRRGALLVACNRDRNFPVEKGKLMPGCGPLVAAIEYASNTQAKYVVGKPHTFMVKLLAKEHGVRRSELLVVGDTYDSDIEMAYRYGCKGLLLSKSRRRGRKAAAVIPRITDLLRHVNLN